MSIKMAFTDISSRQLRQSVGNHKKFHNHSQEKTREKQTKYDVEDTIPGWRGESLTRGAIAIGIGEKIRSKWSFE